MFWIVFFKAFEAFAFTVSITRFKALSASSCTDSFCIFMFVL